MVEAGQLAAVHYTARLVDGPEAGNIVDTTDVDVAQKTGIYHGHRDYKPLEFRVGESNVIPALDRMVRTMEAGESRTEVVEPEDAFGEYDDSKVREFTRKEIAAIADGDPEEESIVTTEDGRSGWVTDVDDERVVIDFNHELADEPLELEVRLLRVRGEPGQDSAKDWKKKYGKRQSE